MKIIYTIFLSVNRQSKYVQDLTCQAIIYGMLTTNMMD
jgi:hypothetical protein